MKQSTAEKQKLTYRQVGDYLLPNLVLPESPNVGRWGELRRRYLRERKDGEYTALLATEKLNAHLEEIDRSATEMCEELTARLKKLEGITEKLKAQDQLKWVACMENIRNRVEEIVKQELIYD